MKIHSYNEWDSLKSVIVGSATNANWPRSDPVFAQESERTLWRETPVPSGAVPQWIVDETNEDLQGLVDILTQAGVEVLRPTVMNFVALDGMYNYCPRDRLLVAGDTIVDPAMMYPCRDQEAYAYEFLLSHDHRCLTMPRNSGMILDAANVCRLNDTWLFLESHSGNRLAAEWLRERFSDIHIEMCNFYSGVHIDSTIVPVREGLVMLNASRVTADNCPQVFRNWDKIWVDEVVAQDFYQYPYASRWIAMNTLSINPNTLIMDRAQTKLITTLERRGITVIPHNLRHSRTLGGGFHCVTLDLWREHA